jgi:hypothetical protein
MAQQIEKINETNLSQMSLFAQQAALMKMQLQLLKHEN